MEQWAKIADHPGYEVSDLGRVRSWRKSGPNKEARREEPRILKPTPMRAGHLYVKLNGDQCYVHRLVLQEFVGPCPEGEEGLHGDDDPTNNALWNLRWGTRLENMADRARNGRQPRGEGNPAAILADDEVEDIRDAYFEGGFTQREIARAFGVSQPHVSRIVNFEVRA